PLDTGCYFHSSRPSHKGPSEVSHLAQVCRPTLIRPCSCAPIISAFEVQFGLDVRMLQPDDPRLDRSPFMRKLLDSTIRILVLVVIVLIAIIFPSFVSYLAHPNRVLGTSSLSSTDSWTLCKKPTNRTKTSVSF